MYVIFRDGSDRFLGRYCGFTAPGPVESPRGAVGIRIVLHTDQENVASGFKARYIFEVAKSVFGDCGGNFSGQESGIIQSPNYPAKYDGPGKGLASRACNWYVSVRNGYRVSMHFEMFSVEGDPAGTITKFNIFKIAILSYLFFFKDEDARQLYYAYGQLQIPIKRLLNFAEKNHLPKIGIIYRKDNLLE